MRTDFPSIDDLPGSVQEIAEVIGVKPALRLVGKLPTCYSGLPGKKSNRVILYVPKKVNTKGPLAQIIGLDAAIKLTKEFGGETLYPANCRALFKKIYLMRHEAFTSTLKTLGCREIFITDFVYALKAAAHKSKKKRRRHSTSSTQLSFRFFQHRGNQ